MNYSSNPLSANSPCYSMECPTPLPHQVNMVIYHKGCKDGYGAAFAAWLLLGNSAVYIPAMHGDPPPLNYENKHIVICDFAFPRAVTLHMLQKAASMLTLDHHDTSASDLSGVPNCIFNNQQSGAVLAWNFFHYNVPVPRLLLHIQDSDLWMFKLPETKAILSVFDQMQWTFDNWLNYCNPTDPVGSERNLQLAAQEGRPIILFIQNEIEKLAKRGTLRTMQGHTVVVLNTSNWIDEVGHVMAKKFMHQAKFAVVWFYDHVKRSYKFSLRSVKNEIHMGRFAMQFGGGGHAQSAAFRWTGHIENLFEHELKMEPKMKPHFFTKNFEKKNF